MTDQTTRKYTAENKTVDTLIEREKIESGETAIGIELGSTRIKAVLVDEDGKVLASGERSWENSLIDGIWTYSLDEVRMGLAGCYAELKKDVAERFDLTLATSGAIGISAMMHGYLPFDRKGNQLAPFQTWRNVNTQDAADRLSDLFHFHIPMRWSVAHLYQEILDGSEHVKQLNYMTTLSGCVHYWLTGERVLGISDASGMFPIDPVTKDYDQKMVDQFDDLIRPYGFTWKFRDVMPVVLEAGSPAGVLTKEGALLLDPDGDLQSGIPLCPPEGDAGTGMTATCAVRPGTGNISAGTSTFAMIVLEKPLKKAYREIDIVATPTGMPVAMSHASNGTSDLNAWVGVFMEFAEAAGFSVTPDDAFRILFTESLKGDPDCGDVLSFGYYSGEEMTDVSEGRPLLVRTPHSHFSLANLMRSLLYTSVAVVQIGLDILTEEGVNITGITGHGGMFKTKKVMQRYLAAASGVPVTVLDTAGEGGSWGVALLALFMKDRKPDEILEDFLENKIFRGRKDSVMMPDEKETAGFRSFLEYYKAGLPIEREAVRCIPDLTKNNY